MEVDQLHVSNQSFPLLPTGCVLLGQEPKPSLRLQCRGCAPVLDGCICMASMEASCLGLMLWTPSLFLALNHVAFNLLAFSEIELYMCKHFEKHSMLLVNSMQLIIIILL